MSIYLTMQIGSPADIDMDGGDGDFRLAGEGEEEEGGGGYIGDHGDRDSLDDISHSNHSNFLNNLKYNEDLINSGYNSQDDIHLSHDMSGQYRGEDSPRLGFIESEKEQCDSSHLNSIYQRVGAAFSGKGDLDSSNVSYDSSSTSKSTLRPLPLFSYDRRSQEREREYPGMFACICVYIYIHLYIFI
jgi:hypothetical protein